MKTIVQTMQSIAAAGVIWVILAGPGLLADGAPPARVHAASAR